MWTRYGDANDFLDAQERVDDPQSIYHGGEVFTFSDSDESILDEARRLIMQDVMRPWDVPLVEGYQA